MRAGLTKLGVSSRVELVLYAISSTKRIQAANTQSDGLESALAGAEDVTIKKLPRVRREQAARQSRPTSADPIA